MSAYRIEFTREALKVMSKLDKPVRRRVQMAIDRLGDNPRPAGIEPVKSQPGRFRTKTGDWRIIYEIRDRVLIVVVVDVGHRSQVYR